jgi:predicted DNA-binding protein
MTYLTDGVHLYEIAAQRTVQNYGLRRGTISYTIIRDCVSEAIATVDDLYLAALSEVRSGAHSPV